MKHIWLGQGYKKQFELLDITQEGLNILEEMFIRLSSSDKETRNMYNLIYRDKYSKKRSAIDWEISTLRLYFKDYDNTPENFMSFISKQHKVYKRCIFYLVKEIFKKKK